MLVRSALLAGLLCLPFLSGCSTNATPCGIDDPPPFKFDNFNRLGVECAWFYADVQDVIFGVDYDAHIESRFPSNPYR